jgi:hypothetical protein
VRNPCFLSISLESAKKKRINRLLSIVPFQALEKKGKRKRRGTSTRKVAAQMNSIFSFEKDKTAASFFPTH